MLNRIKNIPIPIYITACIAQCAATLRGGCTAFGLLLWCVSGAGAQNAPADSALLAAIPLSPNGFTYEAEALLSHLKQLDTSHRAMLARGKAYMQANPDQPRVAKRLNRWRFFWDNRVDSAGNYRTYFDAMRTIPASVCTTGGNTWQQVGPVVTEADGTVKRQVSSIITAIYSPIGSPDVILAGSNTSGFFKPFVKKVLPLYVRKTCEFYEI